MSTLVDIRDVPQHMVMYDVTWDYYEQTLKEIGDQNIRVAYLDGVMELMSPLPGHERPKKAIATLLVVLTMERRIPLTSLGSTTFRKEPKAAGSEPDECYYFNEIDSVREMTEFDPAVHRAPDLWVEVDLRNPSVPREPIYARLGVPELWRYAGRKLTVRLLTPEGVYVDSASSLAFPILPIEQFASFISKMVNGDELTTMLEFREWVKTLPA